MSADAPGHGSPDARIDVRLPALAASMTSAHVLAWRKRVGESVKPGDVLVEIETDKSAVELEASEEGVLAEILVPDGAEDVAVGTLLARLAPAGSDVASAAPLPAPAPRAAASASPAAAIAPAVPAAAPPASPASSAPRTAAPPDPPRVAHATPLARRMAAQAGLALGALAGSGAGGRITRSDVERALGGLPAAPPAAPAQAPAADASAGEAPYRELRHSVLRRTQAERLSEAKRTIPHFYLALSCEVDALVSLRRDVSRRLEAAGEGRVTLGDFLVRAAALALREVPEANVAWTDTHLRRYERVDVAVAVASERGLVTPVVRDAASKPVRVLAAELRALAERARSGRLRPDEYHGGTCTVSNLGMHGVESLLPILNPPQACILGLGAAEPRAVVRDGAVVARTMLTCTLAADHRALDGATGARLLAAFRRLVEDPLGLLV